MEKCSNPKCPGSLTLADFLKCLLAKSATVVCISKLYYLCASDMEGRMFCLKNDLASTKLAF